MPDGITVKVEGLAELERAMNRLDERLAKKGAIEAGRAGINLLKRAVIAKARATFKAKTGRLFRGIRTSFRIRGRGVKGATVWFYVGLTKKGKDSPFYGRIWETGRDGQPWIHVGRAKRSKLGRLRRGIFGRRGRGEARERKIGKPQKLRPFMGPAFEENKERVLAAVVAKLRKFL